jgi:hypothetical protein
MTINRKSMLDYVDGVIAGATEGKMVQLLGVLRAHMAAEIAEDIDGLLATLSPKQVQYRTWGASAELSPGTHEAVVDFYRSRKRLGQLYFQYDIDRLTVGDDVIVTDGVMISLLSGAAAAELGFPGLEPSDVYEVTTRICTTWPFDDTGLLTGEESYTVPLDMRKLDDTEVPDEFRQGLNA